MARLLFNYQRAGHKLCIAFFSATFARNIFPPINIYQDTRRTACRPKSSCNVAVTLGRFHTKLERDGKFNLNSLIYEVNSKSKVSYV
jgi:hypothetical protein